MVLRGCRSMVLRSRVRCASGAASHWYRVLLLGGAPWSLAPKHQCAAGEPERFEQLRPTPGAEGQSFPGLPARVWTRAEVLKI